MFSIVTGPIPEYVHDDRVVEDSERNVWLRKVRRDVEFPGAMMLLSVDGSHVHMDVRTELNEDPETGRPYVTSYITAFGSNPIISRLTGVTAHRFITKAEGQAFLMLGVEALLVFGDNYNGLGRPAGMYRVRLSTSGQEREYTLVDFPDY